MLTATQFVAAYPHATIEDARAASAALGLKYDAGRGGVGYCQLIGGRQNGVTRFAVRANTDANIIPEAKVRSERHVYTPSGKKRTSKEICLRIWKRTQDRAAFMQLTISQGVKSITAETYYMDLLRGRIQAA